MTNTVPQHDTGVGGSTETRRAIVSRPVWAADAAVATSPRFRSLLGVPQNTVSDSFTQVASKGGRRSKTADIVSGVSADGKPAASHRIGTASTLDAAVMVLRGESTMQMPVEWYTRQEAARRLSLAPATLKRLAAEGKGPAYSRSGERKGKCLYAAADLAAWAEARKRITTPHR
jgi:hypothetical protein